ncbi:MAG: tRNA (guanosine(37)-N1)-methyltransferase TrmD [Hyphomicrobiaceae bacterium]|nr:tRNA (guanosine(37)-N1)-methyltransferase TrmD [Hyphomicrobiaceae bacterium]
MPHRPSTEALRDSGRAPFRVTVLTLFPEVFPGPLAASLTGQALTAGLWTLRAIPLREFGRGRHRTVDDRPAGGGAGMVMRADVLADAVDHARLADADLPLIYLSPRGKPFDQAMARDLSQGPGMVLLCGRFEGIDERVIAGRNMTEVSIGDFVLSGGEIAAMAMVDACLRLVPGVLGAPASLESETFEAGLLEYPHYTRPRTWEGRDIPDVLLSGDHGAIARWRRQEAEALTAARRPDLLPPAPVSRPAEPAAVKPRRPS